MLHNAGGKIVLWGLILAALIFTAIRTIHFLQMTFPPSQQYIAYVGLAMFDVGVLGWLYYAMHSAEGAAQRAIAYGMIFVCAAGVCVTTIMDMTLVSAENGYTKIPPEWFTVGLWAVIIVIIANFMSGILVHLTSPAQKQRMEIQHVRDAIHAQTLEHIRQQKNTIAPQIAQQVAGHWAQQTISEMTGHIPSQQHHQLSAPVVESTGATADPLAMQNGRKNGKA